jgi:hypothetical protein
VGDKVGVTVGVAVGPNNFPGPQLESNRANTNTDMMIAFLLVFIFLLRYDGRARRLLSEP